MLRLGTFCLLSSRTFRRRISKNVPIYSRNLIVDKNSWINCRRFLTEAFDDVIGGQVRKLFPTDQYRIREMLETLKRRRIYDRNDYLFYAPEFSLQSGNAALFSDVIDEWFRQCKPIFDQSPVETSQAPVQLMRLGQINRKTNGSLWRNTKSMPAIIDYFLDRMSDADGGLFEYFPVEDIVGALAGVRDFALYLDKPTFDSVSFDKWIIELSIDVKNLKSSDPGYCFLERRSSYVLYLLAGTCSFGKLPHRFVARLCELAKKSFDQRIIDNADQNRRMGLTVDDKVSCYYYAHTFLFWLTDPNKIVVDSWKSWYGVCALALESHLIDYRKGENPPPILSTLRFVACVLSVAVEFHRDEEFWGVFILWKRMLKEALQRIDSESNDLRQIRTNLADFVYNLGLFCRRMKAASDERRLRFRSFLPALEDSLASIRLEDELSQIRALSAFRNVKFSLDLRDYRLSKRYMSMMWRWLSTEGSKISTISDLSATILFLLKDMGSTREDLPDFLLSELFDLFLRGLDQLPDKDVNRALTYFGDVCVNLNLFPEQIMRSNQATDLWEGYFKKGNYYLERVWPNQRIPTKNLTHFMSVFSDVAFRFQRFEEFRQTYPIFQERLLEIFDTLSPKQCYFLYKAFKRMKDREGLPVGDEMLEALRDRGSHAPQARSLNS